MDDPEMQQVMMTVHQSQSIDRGHDMLNRMAEADPLDPVPLNLNGRLYLQHYEMTDRQEPRLLERAAECFRAAAARNPADYKNFSGLMSTYLLLAENSATPKRQEWLEKALKSGRAAVERYPGSAKLRVELGRTAEQLRKTGAALIEYKKAIEIEDAYRRQFRRMFPDKEPVSRLGADKYTFAQDRVRALSK